MSVGSKNEGIISKPNFGKGDSIEWLALFGCVKLRFDISKHSTHYQAEKIRRKGTALSYSRFLLLPVRVNSIHRNLEVRIGIETLNQFNDFSRNLEPLKCLYHFGMKNLIKRLFDMEAMEVLVPYGGPIWRC